jgi:hypothetical protein
MLLSSSRSHEVVNFVISSCVQEKLAKARPGGTDKAKVDGRNHYKWAPDVLIALHPNLTFDTAKSSDTTKAIQEQIKLSLHSVRMIYFGVNFKVCSSCGIGPLREVVDTHI